MYSRSEIRHACFRARSKYLSSKNEEVLSVIKPLLAAHQRFDNFTDEWDILVTSDNKVVIIKPETDLEFIRSTCLEKQFQTNYGVDKELSPRKQNVIVIVEASMLEGKMSWENFDSTWGVNIDAQFKTISTTLFTKAVQKEVTEQMIKASKVSEDNTPHTGKSNGIIEITPKKISPVVAKTLLTNRVAPKK